jgi:SAM-dependent methyltransferase
MDQTYFAVAETVSIKTSCPACLKPRAAFSFRKGVYDLFHCDACDFIFVHPFPSNAEIAAHYETNYRGASADFYPKSSSRRWRAFVRSLKFLRYATGRDVLDIGCGGGFMAEAFARIGARVSGLDISQNSIDYARKHFQQCNFYCESFTDFRARNQTYDFVFSSEVLEHLPGPDEFMKTLSAVTRPGGFVYLSAPDAGHPAVPAKISDWNDICPPEHLEFFNAGNLTMLFERYGFRSHRNFSSKTPAHSRIFRKFK